MSQLLKRDSSNKTSSSLTQPGVAKSLPGRRMLARWKSGSRTNWPNWWHECSRESLSPLQKNNFKVDEINDIGVVEDNTTELTIDKKLCNVIIVYSGCYACEGKVLPRSDTLGDCTRCQMTHRLERCSTKMSERVDVEGVEGMRTLTILSPLVEEICEGEPATVEILLPSFDAVYSKNDIMVFISRE